MSILVCETYANPNTPLYGNGSDPSTWSLFPAVSDVNMNENGIVNLSSITGVSGISGYQIQLNTPINYDTIQTGNGNMLNAGGSLQLHNTELYVADNITSAPQCPNRLPLLGLDTTILAGFTYNVSNGVDEIHWVQTDSSQNYWKLHFSISFQSDALSPLSLYPEFSIDNGDNVLGFTMFNSSNPYILSPIQTGSGTYTYNVSFSDVLNFGPSVVSFPNTINNCWMNVLIGNIFSISNIRVNNIRFTYSLEPMFVISGI